MPRIFDNLSSGLFLLPALQETLNIAHRADFCVGYFNLRGWRSSAEQIDPWPGGDGNCCRVLVGMQQRPEEEFRAAIQQATLQQNSAALIDNATALRLHKWLAQGRQVTTLNSPYNQHLIDMGAVAV